VAAVAAVEVVLVEAMLDVLKLFYPIRVAMARVDEITRVGHPITTPSTRITMQSIAPLINHLKKRTNLVFLAPFLLLSH